MYLQHYGLERFPFDITSDPDFLWTGDNHRHALEVLREGVFEGRGFVVLTGEVGTGKTTLINAFRRLDDIATIIVTIPDPDMEVMDFFYFLSHEFEIEGDFATPEEFVQTFKSFLLRAYASYRKVLIIIDEAQRLNNKLLAEISNLAKIEMAGRRLLKIFFVGQLEFHQILMTESNRSILDEVVAAQRLEPLSELEIQSYVNRRLAVAGCDRDLFASQTFAAIFEFTRGLPRSVNVLCDRALFTGFHLKAEMIDQSIIRRCTEKISLPNPSAPVPVSDIPVSPELREPVKFKPPNNRQAWKIAGLVCLILVFLLGGSILAYRFVTQSDILSRAIAIFKDLIVKFLTD